jgi:hypothetical protein
MNKVLMGCLMVATMITVGISDARSEGFALDSEVGAPAGQSLSFDGCVEQASFFISPVDFFGLVWVAEQSAAAQRSEDPYSFAYSYTASYLSSVKPGFEDAYDFCKGASISPNGCGRGRCRR